MFLSLILIVLLSIVEKIQSLNSYVLCNGEKSFTRNSQNLLISWPESQFSPLICSYFIKSPIDTFISATIYHEISGSEPKCSAQQRIWISRDGNYDFKGASYFCGLRGKNNPLRISSIGNIMSILIVSTSLTGSVHIALNFNKNTQKNCDCRCEFIQLLMIYYKTNVRLFKKVGMHEKKS